MRPQYSHNVLTSFVMYLDNLLTNTGGAYVNVTGSLYRGSVTGIPGYVYSSPYRSWVWDSCSYGANVPSGFYTTSGQFLTSGSGIGIDYLNGWVVTPYNWGPTLSGTYARKEVNVYPSTTEESEYILQKLYNEDINIKYPLTGLYGREYVAPLVMVTPARGFNEPWALGGVDNSTNIMRCFVISNNNYIQEGVNSLVQDMAHKSIPYVPITSAPLTNVGMTATGTLKKAGWSYCQDIRDQYPCSLYVAGTYTFKIGERSNMNPTFLLSIMDADLVQPRFS